MPGKDYITNSVDMHLVLIPKGKFTMGASEEEEGSIEDERPQHEVEITHDFYLSVHEVTQEQYEAVIGTNPSSFKGPDLPVENVSWTDANAFCQKLSMLEKEREAKRTYRLPTEAEWEYACRGRVGSQTPFNIQGTDGLSVSSEFANFNGGFPYGNAPRGYYRRKTSRVGSFPPNDFGLHDMHGNVWEWCQDWYGPYRAGAQQDPQGPSAGSDRVLRGGSFYYVSIMCRAATRFRYDPENHYGYRGIRVVCMPGKTP